jgi:hypothetical protein
MKTNCTLQAEAKPGATGSYSLAILHRCKRMSVPNSLLTALDQGSKQRHCCKSKKVINE